MVNCFKFKTTVDIKFGAERSPVFFEVAFFLSNPKCENVNEERDSLPARPTARQFAPTICQPFANHLPQTFAKQLSRSRRIATGSGPQSPITENGPTENRGTENRVTEHGPEKGLSPHVL